ncbi:IS66 family insertion sequence element accessory protein TnpB [Burkholderia thailandensis]
MRSGFNSLAAKVQTVLERDPFSGHVFVFRGKRGDLVKVLWWSGDGMCLLMKRLERGRFVWPRADGGVVCLSQAQLSMLLEGTRLSTRPGVSGISCVRRVEIQTPMLNRSG